MPVREPILVLGKYEILEAVGSGGMATVYRARITGPMGFEKPAAVKLLNDEAAKDDEIVRMFIDEARIGALLVHPHIAGVTDFGDAGGRYYIAMEYVDGVSLGGLFKFFAKGRKTKLLDVRAAVHVASCVLKALGHAHAAVDKEGKALGIVHRDVSPQNVLLDRSGMVKLCDFGIATGAYRLEKTAVGVVKGKAGYMAPEQAAGGRVDARSDLYSLGLTLFAMLAGPPVFSGSDTSAVRAAAAQGLPAERIQALDIDDGLKAVLLKACAPKPLNRFQTAAEFLDALTAVSPDPREEGRELLRKALTGVPDNAGRTIPAQQRKKAKEASAAVAASEAAVDGSVASRAPQTQLGSAKGVRNVLIGAGVLLLIALFFALFQVNLPE